MFAKNWDYDGDWQEKVKRRMSRRQKVKKYTQGENIMQQKYELKIFGDDSSSYSEMQSIVNWLDSYFRNVLKQNINLILDSKEHEEDVEGKIYTAKFNSDLSLDELNKVFSSTFKGYDFDIVLGKE